MSIAGEAELSADYKERASKGAGRGECKRVTVVDMMQDWERVFPFKSGSTSSRAMEPMK